MVWVLILVGIAAVSASGLAITSRRQVARLHASMDALVRDLAPLPDDTSPDLELLSMALDATRLAVVVADEDGSIVYANSVAADLLAAHDSRVLVGDALAVALSESSTETVEREVGLIGPPAATFTIRVDPVWVTGNVTSKVAVIEDVSAGRRLDHLRRDFVANIGHELKTPVGAVGLLADALAAEARDVIDPALIIRLVERISSEMERLAATIADLLTLSRVEAGDELKFEMLDLSEVAAEVIDRLAVAADAAGIDVTQSCECPEGTTVEVLGDRRQLTSAVSNLVDNAIKYSPSGRAVQVRVRRSDANACVDVIDHGIGIPARDLARVFERFYRVDFGRSRDTGGTGLGLAIVRHVAANHGGTVQVESREGSGSIFGITLPVSLDDVKGE